MTLDSIISSKVISVSSIKARTLLLTLLNIIVTLPCLVRDVPDQPDLLPGDPVPAPAGVPVRAVSLPAHHAGPQSPLTVHQLHGGHDGGRRLAGGRL